MALELHVRVAVAGDGGRVTLEGVMLPQVKPAGIVSVRLTVPLNDPTPVIVIVEVADVPTVTDAGEVAAIVNSFWVMVKVAVVE